ncbi:proline-rich transmembrane protein 3 [Perognathus longimembris pacificus]|uniref:proline-rich transmembrane protein 3 n=1 Tax=Perognathus longimembris pacificus TaxID=214514 RepID=UPI0020194A0B|nr:proline-rich transmembrane protein 3 [Perognathus longimembris pacificus]
MAPRPRGLLLLLLLPSLGAGPALGRGLRGPPEDSQLYLVPSGPQDLDRNPRDESLWHVDTPQAPDENPKRPTEPPPGPALHGPRAAHRGQGERLPLPDDLQLARGPSSQGWTGLPDSQEPLEEAARGPLPLGPPNPAFIPTSPQPRVLTDAPSTPEPGGPGPQRPPGEEALKAKAKTGVPQPPPGGPQGPPHTARRPAQGGPEDFQEVAQAPLSTQQDSAPPAGAMPPQGPGAQPDLALAKSLPPAEELPLEPPKMGGAAETWDASSPGPGPQQPDPSEVQEGAEPQPTSPPAPQAPSGGPKPAIAAVNGADPISPQRVRGAVEPPGTSKSLLPHLSDRSPATNPTESPAGARQPDEVEAWPGRPQSHPPAPPVQAPSTSRRGLIRVTTQRALGQPLPPEPSASAPAAAPASSPPANATAPPLRWGPLRRVLSFAWELHVYGAGVLFLLPALLAAATLAAAALAGPRPALALAAAALVLAASGLRSAYMLADPYGSQARLGVRAGLALYNLPFPLLLAALAALTLRGLGAGLPPPLRSPLLLGAAASLHGGALLAADLLSPRPLFNLLAQGLSCAWGASAALGTLCLCRRRLLAGPRGGDARPGPRLLAVAGSLGLLASGLQLAAALWLYPGPGREGRFSWAWWGVHFWLRLLELAWALALALGALAAARPRPPTEHACWAKLLRLACPAPPGKSEVPERPNNCYAAAAAAGPGGLAGPDLGKSLIRNPPEAAAAWGSAASLGRGRPGGPGPSRGSVGPAPSLSELDLRPPSPINLSRSIDAALFREHLVRDSVFRRCGLRGLASPPPPGGALRPRRGSHPDAEPDGGGGGGGGSLRLRGRCRSLSDVRVRGPVPPHVAADETERTGACSGSSLDSFSRGSLKISWNPWRHGLSSVDSLPLDELPSTVQLLPAPTPAPAPAGPRVHPRCKPGDSRSASSDTIELTFAQRP